MSKKPNFTDTELEELNLIHYNLGYSSAFHEILKFLETNGYSKASKVVTDLRVEFNKRVIENDNKRAQNFINSALSQKLWDRINYEIEIGNI